MLRTDILLILLIILVIYLIYLIVTYVSNKEYYYHNIKEHTKKNSKAVMFLSVNPHVELIRFAERLSSSYDVFISIDNNNADIPLYDEDKIKMIRYNGEPDDNGYKGSVLNIDRASSRCKALYYLCEKCENYESIWMIEDDVFIPSVRTLRMIDSIYPETIDLLSASYTINNDDTINDWHWHLNRGKIATPWAGGAICAIRLSMKLLQLIRLYTISNKTLLMDEMMFHTLAYQNGLNIVIAPELEGIVWRRDWKIDEISENSLFHPIKDMDTQVRFRKELGFQ